MFVCVFVLVRDTTHEVNITGDAGWFYSAHFPHDYFNNLNCTYNFIMHRNCRLCVEFYYFQLEPFHDQVDFHGLDTDSSRAQGYT